jgi:hypothetical protein
MEAIVRAAGLGAQQAEVYAVHDEEVLFLRVGGDPMQVWRTARAGLTDHYPVLIDFDEQILEPDFHPELSPSTLVARSGSHDLDGHIAGRPGTDEDLLGTGDEGYLLDSYDALSFGPPQYLVIVPRPEPWAAFAYMSPYSNFLGLPPELPITAARRWYDRYGAEPFMIGLATGFTGVRPPTEIPDAEQLVVEHLAVAGLSARTKHRAYARALTQLDHWCLYDRP